VHLLSYFFSLHVEHQSDSMVPIQEPNKRFETEPVTLHRDLTEARAVSRYALVRLQSRLDSGVYRCAPKMPKIGRLSSGSATSDAEQSL
jgi:hypothetical protein